MVKIGLEIHGYLATKKKLFCECLVSHGKKFSKPNTNICPICIGEPGSKPMLPNAKAVEKSILVSLLLGCEINKSVLWQRKHYSWPDLPKGFQSTISGPHSIPNAVNGKFGGIRIRECHLEEDPAAWNPITGEVDYNRSGSPLIEIVTEPDFSSSQEVVQWLENLVFNLSYVTAIDKKSGIKVDVNISIEGGKRVEVKNINSMRKIRDAIDIEIERQKVSLPRVEETRTYDEEKRTTFLMRTKDSAIDYRFIVEPDLPPLTISELEVKRIKSAIPELPEEKLRKLVERYKIGEFSLKVLTSNLSLVIMFEKLVEKINPDVALAWLTVELLGVANYNKLEIDDLGIQIEDFSELLDAVQNNKISDLKAKDILRKWANGSYSPTREIEESSFIAIEEIEKYALEAISENEKVVCDYKNGQKSAINFLLGVIMKKSNKRADSVVSRKILEELLK